MQNALFEGAWRHTDLVIPSVVYTEPELATVGLTTAAAAAAGVVEVDEFTTSLSGNDRAILEGDDDAGGFVHILCRKGTDEIVGATVCAPRAGEIINELTLAIKAGVGLAAVGRNVHPYPTTSEAVMGCGLQWINARWKRL